MQLRDLRRTNHSSNYFFLIYYRTPCTLITCFLTLFIQSISFDIWWFLPNKKKNFKQKPVQSLSHVVLLGLNRISHVGLFDMYSIMWCAWDFRVLLARTGFSCFIPTHSISSDPHYEFTSHSFFSICATPTIFLLISSVYISRVWSGFLSSARSACITPWCTVRAEAAASMGSAEWIRRGIRCTLSLITDPSAKWRVSLCVHCTSYF